MIEAAVVNNGLDGIIVAETKISQVDGQLGQLIICGFDAEELAFASTFEQTCALLWSSTQKVEASQSTLQKQFGKARRTAFELLQANPFILQQAHPMDALRTATSLLTGGTETDICEFARITGAIGFFAASWSRLHSGLPLSQPDESLSHAADFLRLLANEPPTDAQTKALDIYWTTVSDHGMNASTFAARVVASTESDNISAIVAAIGALKGPLHGGAPGPVLEMLNAIGTPENADKWLTDELNGGRRIMGMGHRIYKVRDPRAAIFEKAIRQLETTGQTSGQLALARAVEKQAEQLLAQRHPERPLKANVEFYTAVLLDAIGIPHNLFSTMFAAGRAAGWCAHIAEQRATGRLIRPASRYTGSYPSQS